MDGGEKSSASQKPEGSSIFSGWKKFLAPPNFVKTEEELKTMDPTSRMTFDIMMKRIDALIASTQNENMRAELNYAKADMLIDREKGKVAEDFVVEFFEWILGRSSKNVKYDLPPERPNGELPQMTLENYPILTPWGNKPYTHLPDVKDFIDTIVDERAHAEKFIAKLKLRWPRNLPELWFWWKYITNKQGLNGPIIEYARFLEPYMGAPTEKVPINPETGNPTYVYRVMDEDGNLVEGNGESFPVEAYNRFAPNPPPYQPQLAEEALAEAEELIDEGAVQVQNHMEAAAGFFDLPDGGDPDPDGQAVLAMGGIVEAFKMIRANEYMFPGETLRNFDAKLAGKIAALPDSIYKTQLIQYFGYGYEDNGLPTRAAWTLDANTMRVFQQGIQTSLGDHLQKVSQIIKNQGTPAMVPSQAMAGNELGILSNHIQELTNVLKTSPISAYNPDRGVHSVVPPVYEINPEIHVKGPIQVKWGAPKIIGNDPVFVKPKQQFIPGQKIFVQKNIYHKGEDTVLYDEGYEDVQNLGGEIKFTKAQGKINVKKDIVGKPPVNIVYPEADYEQEKNLGGHGELAKAQGKITVKKDIVGKPPANIVYPEVDYEQEQNLGGVIGFAKAQGPINVRKDILVKPQTMVDYPENYNEEDVIGGRVEQGAKQAKIKVKKDVLVKPATDVEVEEGYSDEQVLGGRTATLPPQKIVVKGDNINLSDPILEQEIGGESQSQFPATLSMEEMKSEILSHVVDNMDLDGKLKMYGDGMLEMFSQKIQLLTESIGKLSGNSGEVRLSEKDRQLLKNVASSNTKSYSQNSKANRLMDKLNQKLGEDTSIQDLITTMDKLVKSFPAGGGGGGDLTKVLEYLTANLSNQQKQIEQVRLANIAEREHMTAERERFVGMIQAMSDNFQSYANAIRSDTEKATVKSLLQMNEYLVSCYEKKGGQQLTPMEKSILDQRIAQNNAIINFLSTNMGSLKNAILEKFAAKQTLSVNNKRQEAAINKSADDAKNVRLRMHKKRKTTEGEGDVYEDANLIIDLNNQFNSNNETKKEILRQSNGVAKSTSNIKQQLSTGAWGGGPNAGAWSTSSSTQKAWILSSGNNQSAAGDTQFSEKSYEKSISGGVDDLMNAETDEFGFGNDPLNYGYGDSQQQQSSSSPPGKVTINQAPQKDMQVLDLNKIQEELTNVFPDAMQQIREQVDAQGPQKTSEILKVQSRMIELEVEYNNISAELRGQGATQKLPPVSPEEWKKMSEQDKQFYGQQMRIQGELQNRLDLIRSEANRLQEEQNALTNKNTPSPYKGKTTEELKKLNGMLNKASTGTNDQGDFEPGAYTIGSGNQFFFPQMEYKELGFNSQEEMNEWVNQTTTNLYNANRGKISKSAMKQGVQREFLNKYHNEEAQRTTAGFLQELGQAYSKNLSAFTLDYNTYCQNGEIDDELLPLLDGTFGSSYKSSSRRTAERLVNGAASEDWENYPESYAPVVKTQMKYIAEIDAASFDIIEQLNFLSSANPNLLAQGSVKKFYDHARHMNYSVQTSLKEAIQGGVGVFNEAAKLAAGGPAQEQFLTMAKLSKSMAEYYATTFQYEQSDQAEKMKAVFDGTYLAMNYDVLEGRIKEVPEEMRSRILNNVNIIGGQMVEALKAFSRTKQQASSIPSFSVSSGSPITDNMAIDGLGGFKMEEVMQEDPFLIH